MWDNIKTLYYNFFISRDSTYFNIFNIPVILEHLFEICSTCVQLRCVSSLRKLSSSTLSMLMLYILRVRVSVYFWYLKNHILFFSLMNDNELIFSHSISLRSSSFIKDYLLLFLYYLLSLKCFNALVSFVSSAYIMKLNILLTSGKSS